MFVTVIARLQIFYLSFAMMTCSVMAVPVAWWRFEGNFDSSIGQGLELLPGANDAISEEVPGGEVQAEQNVENRSSYSSGSDKGAELAANEIIEQRIKGGSFTVEAFVKRSKEGEDVGGEFCRIIGNAINGAPEGWALMIHNGRLRFFAYSASSGEMVDFSSTDILDLDTWRHVALVALRDGEFLDLQLYVDGELRSQTQQLSGTSDAVIAPSENPYIVGGLNRFHGLIDEIRISDEALSPEQFLKK